MPLTFYQCFTLDFVKRNELQTEEGIFAEKLADIKYFCDRLAAIGPIYGYFPKATKSYFIVKKMSTRFKDHVYWHEGKDHNRGRKHLGVVVGSDTCKVQYVKDLSSYWKTHIKLLSTIEEH